MGSRGAYDAYRHRSDIGQLISEYFVMNVLLQAGARASADAWSPRGSRDWGQVAPHLPLRPHQLLLQQPRPSPPEPGVHRWVIGSFVHICRDHWDSECDVWQSQCDVSRVTKLFPGPHPSADVNRAPRSGERRGDGYKLSPTTKTLLIIVFRDGKRQNNFVTERKNIWNQKLIARLISDPPHVSPSVEKTTSNKI